MVRALILLLVTSLMLSACGWRDSRLNPGNWFGNSRDVPVESAEVANPLIPATGPNLLRGSSEPEDRHVRVSQVVELVVEPTNSGAIIRAIGVGRVQGAYAARLRRESGNEEDILVDDNGVLTYAFEVLYPENPRPVGTEASRRVMVARSLTHDQLAQVRTIRVLAEANARETRRR